jgi:hypothetical protein
MKKRMIGMPEIGLIAATRMMAGLGLGLLVSDRFKKEHRKEIGWTLLAVGVLSTIPLAADVLLRHQAIEDGDLEKEGEAELDRNEMAAVGR